MIPFSWLDSLSWSSPRHFWGFKITHRQATHTVGLLWTSDQPFAEISTWQLSKITHDPGRIPISITIKRGAARPAGSRIKKHLKGRTYCVIVVNFRSFFLGGGWLRRNTKTLLIKGAQKHNEYISRDLGYISVLGKLWYWQYLTLHNEFKLLHAVHISNYCHEVCPASTKIVPLSTELHVALSLYLMTSCTVATDALFMRFCKQQQILHERSVNCSDKPCVILCNANLTL